MTFAAPTLARDGVLHFAFDEDELTLATDAVQAAGLAPGAGLHAEGIDLPPWWWAGMGLRADAQGKATLRLVATRHGPAALVASAEADRPADAEAMAARAAQRAAPLDAAALARVSAARDGPDGEADFPLGAYVLPARHDEVTAERLRLPPGQVLSWTAIGSGAAPSEFARLQAAVGAYHVVLVECGDRRTVGLWAGRDPPRAGQAVRPVLRRLFRTQGAWRHGVKFVPA